MTSTREIALVLLYDAHVFGLEVAELMGLLCIFRLFIEARPFRSCGDTGEAARLPGMKRVSWYKVLDEL